MRIVESSEEVKILIKRCSICNTAMDAVCPSCGKGNPVITNTTMRIPKSLLKLWFGED